MNLQRAIAKNIRFHARYYRLTAVATLICVAVIVGSLLVGDSVRATLVGRVNERLGDTETIVFSKQSFFESKVTDAPLFGGWARGVLLSNGFLSDNGRLIPVMIWGVDDKNIVEGGAMLNAALAAELSAGTDALALRLPATGLLPSGSLFVTDNYTVSARLSRQGILTAAEGGNIHLKNEQTLPFNIFVNRQELAAIMEVEGKINLILSPLHITADDFAEVWNPVISGLKAEQTDEGVEISTDRVFIQREAVASICANNPTANRLFSYMVNAIETNGRNIPYSFATAIDRYDGRTLQAGELILSDYAATRLQARLNDSLLITFFRSEDLKTLHTDTLYGRVSAIVPLAKLFADKTLSADFPGLSDVERCTDWDSDLPINMDLITKEDEDYWTAYRSTPKILIPYQSVAPHWSNAYGSATGIRLDSATADLSGLEAAMFGIQIIYPKEIGLNAARGGVDFSSLFLSLGFFIILSAFLLMLLPLSEMMFRRREEISLLTALGYSRKRIAELLWKEAAPVVLLASLVGMVAGLLYTWVILLLLGSLWKGATQTDGFLVSANPYILFIGLTLCVGMILVLLRVVIRRSGREKAMPSAPKRIRTFNARPFNNRHLVWASLYFNRRRALLSFVTLAMGVLVVFAVGLNRQGFGDNSQLLAGTGGYTLWCESSVPIYHNIATEAGRDKLALQALPEDFSVLQALRYSADDASCLNLNKVSQPSVLGLDMSLLEESAFTIQRSIFPLDSTFKAMQTATDSLYPVLIDETVLTWGLMLSLGDTLVYENSLGRQVYLQIAGTLGNSVFQGNVLMDKKLFAQLWGEISGSEILLFKVKETEAEAGKQLIAQALSEYGLKISATGERLKAFNSVVDTYLSIFLSLGGLGLLLGLMSFVVVVRKDMASRKEQIDLYRALGFAESKIKGLLVGESLIVPLAAIVVGILGSLLSISGGFKNVGAGIWLQAFVLSAFFVWSVVVFIHKSVQECLKRN